MMKLKPVKNVQSDDVLYDEESGIFKGSIIPYDGIEMDDMTKLKNQITKAQDDYMLKHRKSDLPMYTYTKVSKPEDIVPPLSEVRMKNAREKKQEKYDKLMLKAC